MSLKMSWWPPVARCSRYLGIALALLTLVGCGFHLQGRSPFPKGISSVYVDYEDDYRVGVPQLVKSLEQRLRLQNLLGDSDAPARLDITRVENKQRLSSVSPVNSDSAEYALTAKVRFDYTVDGHKLLSGQELSVTRTYTVAEAQKLSSEGERNEMAKAMQRYLVDQLLERVARANEKLQTDTDKTENHQVDDN